LPAEVPAVNFTRVALRIAISTFASADDAEKAARLLVESGLAACGTVIPGARSIYRWRGAVEVSEEVVLILKTDADHAGRLAEVLRENHPYELPEIIVIEPDSVSPEYLAWVRESLR